MVGRASLIVILGFSVIFGMASLYWNRESDSATNNMVDYYSASAAHNIAVGAANYAVSLIFQNTADTSAIDGMSGQFPGGGTYDITDQMLAGPYGTRDPYITTTGSFTGGDGVPINDTVRVLLSTYKFSSFAMFDSSDEMQNGAPVYWTTGDTLTGPFQTNGNMYVQGVPVIKGPVTIGGTTYTNDNGQSATANPTKLPDPYGDTLKANSFRSGVVVQMPPTLSSYRGAASSSATFTQSSYSGSNYAYDVYLNFNSGGTVSETDTTRQIASTSTSWQWVNGQGRQQVTTTTWSIVATHSNPNLSLSALENSYGQSVIVVQNGDVNVSGVVNGNVTVVALQGSGASGRSSYGGSNSGGLISSSTNGNVMITGDITYNDNPQTNPASTDMLGLVASNNVMLTTQPEGNVTIDAAIFAHHGSFMCEGYNSTTGNTSNGNYNTFAGYLDLYGSLSQDYRGPVGTTGGTGYLKDYKFDPRFEKDSPPAFPGTTRYKVVSWEE